MAESLPVSKTVWGVLSIRSCCTCWLSKGAMCRLGPSSAGRCGCDMNPCIWLDTKLIWDLSQTLPGVQGAAQQRRELAWQKSAPQGGVNSPGVGTQSTINSMQSQRSRGVALVYQPWLSSGSHASSP